MERSEITMRGIPRHAQSLTRISNSSRRGYWEINRSSERCRSTPASSAYTICAALACACACTCPGFFPGSVHTSTLINHESFITSSICTLSLGLGSNIFLNNGLQALGERLLIVAGSGAWDGGGLFDPTGTTGLAEHAVRYAWKRGSDVCATRQGSS